MLAQLLQQLAFGFFSRHCFSPASSLRGHTLEVFTRRHWLQVRQSIQENDQQEP